MTATIVSAASFDAWFECIIETFEDGQPTLCEIDSLRRFLGGLITPSAAAELLMTIEGEKSSENDPYPFAELLVEAIVHFQAQQPQFIDLLEALHHLPDNGLCVKYQQNQRLLKSRKQEMLESFALILDDMYRSYWAWRYLPPGDSDDTPNDCHRRWESINAFFAHYYVHGMDYGKPSEFPFLGIRQIIDALDEDPWQHVGKDPRYGLMGDFDICVLNAEVPAAAQWLIIAGSTIYDFIVKQEDGDDERQQRVFRDDVTRLRWETWIQKLRLVQLRDCGTRAKDLAKKAVDHMERLERGEPLSDSGFEKGDSSSESGDEPS